MQEVKLNQILLVPGLNVTRDGKAFTSLADREKLAGSFFRDGWIGNEKSAIVTPVECLPESYMSDGLAFRDALPSYIESYNGKVEDSDGVKLPFKFEGLAYEEMAKSMFIGKNPPKYIVVDANRRVESLILANMYRKAQGLPLIMSVPCDVVQVADLKEYYVRSARANMATVGKREVGPLQLLRTAKAIFDNFGKQNHVRQAMPVGSAQKCWAIVVLDKGCPELEIMKKCSDDTKYLASINKSEVGKLSTEALPYVETRKDIPEELRSRIAAYIAKPKKEAAPKMLTREKVKSMIQSPADVVAEVAAAVLNNDQDSVLKLNVYADLLNMVTKGRLAYREDTFFLKDMEGVTHAYKRVIEVPEASVAEEPGEEPEVETPGEEPVVETPGEEPEVEIVAKNIRANAKAKAKTKAKTTK